MSVIGAFAVPHPPIIMPEVGKGEERKIQKTTDAYREAMRRAAALKPDTLAGRIERDGLLVAEAEPGVCRVVCFSPRHDLTLSSR